MRGHRVCADYSRPKNTSNLTDKDWTCSKVRSNTTWMMFFFPVLFYLFGIMAYSNIIQCININVVH